MFRKLATLVKISQKCLDLNIVYWKMEEMGYRILVKVWALVTFGR